MTKNWYVFLAITSLLILSSCAGSGREPLPPTSIPLSNPQNSGSDLEHPISLPEGFHISIYAEGLEKPRMLAFGPDGQLYVTEPGTGRVMALPDRDGDGRADGAEVAVEDLIEPSGIAFYQDGSMYVAETTRVLRFTDPDGDGYFQEGSIITAGIAAGGNTNRTIIFGPDWEHFYLAIGSSCNACREQDERRGGVMRFNADGSEGLIFTTGLRHVIGLDFNPGNEILWAAVMEREGLADGLPPETLYAIYIYADGGWPFCHAGRIIDPDFGSRDSCGEDLLTPMIELEAQSAPYGLEFYTGDQFPEEYYKDAFVALHGTGEGDQASGYKVVRIPLGDDGRDPVEDFAVGWLDENGQPWGTPTDIVEGPSGDLFLSDDYLGVIYRIYYTD
jgi:glucose/arabinose dehydrogenase